MKLRRGERRLLKRLKRSRLGKGFSVCARYDPHYANTYLTEEDREKLIRVRLAEGLVSKLLDEVTKESWVDQRSGYLEFRVSIMVLDLLRLSGV